MYRSLAMAVTGLALTALAAGMPTGSASAQGAPTACNDFVKLKQDAETKMMALQNAGHNHVDRNQMCTLVTRFTGAETLVIKFMVDNKVWCGVPEDVIKSAQANHDKTMKFREVVCAEGQAKPKPPSLSDAIGTPSLDTGKNTKTGKNGGTFDTLTGNPLAK